MCMSIDKVHLQTSCMEALPNSYHYLDSLDPSKEQSTLGTVLRVYMGPSQPGHIRDVKMSQAVFL